jgi:tetratricopeptide (TPR) repeat protein
MAGTFSATIPQPRELLRGGMGIGFERVAINRAKVLDSAQKYLAKGQQERAVAEFMKIVEDDPRDVRTWLKIGDLQAKRGARQEACDAYRKVAEQYAVEGFYLKAVAVHKQILRLDPSRLDVQLELAEMHLRLSMKGEAIQTLDSVARTYARDGDIARTLELLRRMGQIDPDSIPIRIRYAEALSQAGRKEEAADAFGVGAAMLKQQGRHDDWSKVVERQLFHRPNDIALSRELATFYLQRRDPKRALAKLQTCFAADKKNIHTLDLLAVAFEQLGQIPKTISVYKEMAKLLLESEEHEQRATVLNRILELDPNDREARQALGVYAPSTRGSIAPSVPPPVEPAPNDLEAEESPFDSGVVPSQARAMPSGSDAWSTADSTSQESEPYAPRDSAVAFIPRTSMAPPPALGGSSSRPRSPVAADEVDVFAADDDAEELDAVELEEVDGDDDVMILDDDSSVDAVMEPLSERPRPMAPLAEVPRARAEELEESAPMVEIISPSRPGSQSAPLGTLSARQSRPGSIPPNVAQKAQVARLLTECEVFERYGLRQKVIEQLNRVLVIDSRHVEARERLKETFLAMGQIEDAVAQLHALAEITRNSAPDVADRYLSEAALLAGDTSNAQEEVLFVDESETRSPVPSAPPGLAASNLAVPNLDDVEEMSSAEFDAAPLHAAPPGEESEARARSLKPPSFVEETLDEVEFYVEQRLYEEARMALKDALQDFPQNRLLLDKLEELAEVAAEAMLSKPPSRPAPKAEEDESFLLAEKLAAELDQAAKADDMGSDVIDVETVFQQFKKGVEATVSKDDSATHYDLGIAYMEMGLLDDAVNEFELARTDTALECSAYTMIGTCHLRRGAPKDAIEAFKSGLTAKQKGLPEELALRFELGQAYEAVKDTDQALAEYRTVKQKDPNFRDVERRIRALETPGGAGPKETVPERDEIDAAFDDLLAKD